MKGVKFCVKESGRRASQTMPRSLKSWTLHPLLFAVYPVVALYAHNLTQVNPADVIRPLAASLLAALAFLGLLRLLTRSWERASWIVTLWLFLFYTFGHVYRALAPVFVLGVWIGRADILAALWAAIWIVGTWALWRLARPAPDLTGLLNLVAAAALVLACIQLPGYWLGSASTLAEVRAAVQEESPQPAASRPAAGPLPNIYYIVLDEYGRSDVLQSVYGLDNSDFIQGLEARGFSVAHHSRSNYAQTSLSLASALNMNYVEALFTPDPQSGSREPLLRLIENNQVARLLKARGYRTVYFENGYSIRSQDCADITYPMPRLYNAFEGMLLQTSLAALVVDGMQQPLARAQIVQSFDGLINTTQLTGPVFVYAHLLTPHPPFIYNADGSFRSDPFNASDGEFTARGDEYLEAYPGQVQYISSQVLQVIDAILEQSPTPPVILLQGDHGPAAHLDWEHCSGVCLEERMGILNAYYLPGQAADAVDPAITPVNSFRVVLNAIFAENLPLLPDRSYFSSWNKPYQWIDVTSTP